jgi:hypothetical protein
LTRATRALALTVLLREGERAYRSLVRATPEVSLLDAAAGSAVPATGEAAQVSRRGFDGKAENPPSESRLGAGP